MHSKVGLQADPTHERASRGSSTQYAGNNRSRDKAMAATVNPDMFCAQRYRLEPVGNADAYFRWVADNYEKVGQHRGPVPEHLLPKQVRLVKGGNPADFVTVAHFVPLVSAKLKALVEGIEPGTHQFVPVSIVRQDGTAWEEQYYFFSNANLLDAVNPDLGGVYRQDITDNFFDWEVKSGAENVEKLAVYKDRVAGKAMWCDRRFGTNLNLFFSDLLLGRMEAAGVTGCYVRNHWKEI